MGDAADAEPDLDGFDVSILDGPQGTRRVAFAGELRFYECLDHWGRVRDLVQREPGQVVLDVSGLSSIDGGSAALLIEMRSELCRDGRAGVLTGAQGSVARILELYGEHPLQESGKDAPRRLGALDQIGHATRQIWTQAIGLLSYVGQVLAEGAQSFLNLRRFRWNASAAAFSRTGPDAFPIVVLINFLVGLILALQAAVQLRNFGAEIFVADLVGLSVVRELGPLMTAIILAGRSGAAFAAELGTMTVSEEVDALRVLRISPVTHLVLPRLLATLVAAPLLTIAADAFGVFGGLAIGVLVLDLTTVAYWNETLSAIGGGDILTGLFKSVFFGAAVALVGCHRGLSTTGGAEGVGRSTTSAVVTTIFLLVLLDALFTWLFNLFGI